MLNFLVICVCVATSIAYSPDPSLDEHWSNFKKEFRKEHFDGKEEETRREIWEKNVAIIIKHNLEADLGKHTFTLGQNMYTDLTNQEFVSKLNGLRMSADNRTVSLKQSLGEVSVPDAVDWRKEGYVTEVKDQGQCGSCWSFSATGALEGQHKKKTGVLVPLSEQNLIDCSRQDGNKGCEGGTMDNAYKYVIRNGGIDTEKCYPTTGKAEKCKYNPSCIGATCTGYVDLTPGDEMNLQERVATVGPISVGIDASSIEFQLYASGVYDDPNCSSTLLDHAVLIVGYGTDDATSKDFWIVKNSWGPSWGMKGYIMMSRNKNNQCGIASMASYPTM